jgi:dihydroorotate dehydrogenase electron transfer subunit
MSNPLHAACYADHAQQHTVEVLENRQLARATWKLRFRCPAMAANIVPGQFLMAKLHGYDDPLIGRPFAMYEVYDAGSGAAEDIEFVYLVKGKFTRRLQTLGAGQLIDVWGPLGNGFALPTAQHLIMVAGGIGQTPFLSLGQEALGKRRYGTHQPAVEHPRRVTLCYGARSADYLAGVEEFEHAGIEVRIATDDGSRGHHGFVTDVLRELLTESNGTSRQIACCGPEPMMEAVAKITRDLAVPCQVSLETPMACGIGICFSCVARVTDAQGEIDYKRTCVEGPVFDANKIVW